MRIRELSIVALAVLGTAFRVSADDPKEGSTPATAALDDFENSSGRDISALWKAYATGDLSQGIRDRYARLFKTIADSVGRENLDVILDKLEIPHDCPEFEASPVESVEGDAQSITISSTPYAWPVPLLEGSDEFLVAALDSRDALTRGSAAITLIARQKQVKAVVAAIARRLYNESKGTWRGTWRSAASSYSNERQLLMTEFDAYALVMARQLAGSEFDRAICAMIADPKADDSFRVFLVRQVSFSANPDQRETMATLEPFVARKGSISHWALRTILGQAPDSIVDGGHRDMHLEFHASYFKPRELDVAEQAIAVRAIDSFFATHENDALDASDVRRLLVPSSKSPSIREASIRALRPLIDRDDDIGDEALFVLSHLEDGDDALRARYVRRLSKIEKIEEATYSDFPCLVLHDAKTLEAFERVLGLYGEYPEAVVNAVARMRVTDPSLASVEGRIRKVVTDAADGHASWYWLFESGWRDAPVLRDGEVPVNRLMKLAIEIRRRREAKEDASNSIADFITTLTECEEPDGEFGYGDPYSMGCFMVESLALSDPKLTSWALSHLSALDSPHDNMMSGVLKLAKLDHEQRAIIARSQIAGFPPTDVANFLIDDDLLLLQLVPRLREWLITDYRDGQCSRIAVRLDVLDLILRAAPVNRKTGALLVAAIERGSAAERADALTIVEARRVDNDAVNRSVAARENDVDDRVRAIAQRILVSRRRRGSSCIRSSCRPR